MEIKGIPEYVKDGLRTLQSQGYQAYLVGGSVRDLCMGLIPKDFDLCTDALPEDIERVFGEFPHKTYGKKHGTVGVLLEGHWVEITTYRSDGKYRDHRHPDDVTFTRNLSEDLKRRDFTINAMALDLEGNLIDLFNGVDDLQNQIIRCVNVANERFSEDALRILRALRFASRFGFHIENDTADAIHRYAYLLNEVASERIRDELSGILLGKDAVKILVEYDDVIGLLIEPLEDARGFVQFNPNHYEDVYHHTLRVLSFTEPDLTLRLSALLHDLAKTSGLTLNPDGIAVYEHHAQQSAIQAIEVCAKLRFDKKTQRDVGEIIALHETSFPERLSEMCRWIAKTGEKVLLLAIRLRECDLLSMTGDQSRKLENCAVARGLIFEIKNRNVPYQVKHLAINGEDLVKLGYKGPVIQRILENALSYVLENKVENRHDALLAIVPTLDMPIEKQ